MAGCAAPAGGEVTPHPDLLPFERSEGEWPAANGVIAKHGWHKGKRKIELWGQR